MYFYHDLFFSELCDRPNARQTYCSDHGTCDFDETTDNGVICKCDDNWSNNDCNTRQGIGSMFWDWAAYLNVFSSIKDSKYYCIVVSIIIHCRFL